VVDVSHQAGFYDWIDKGFGRDDWSAIKVSAFVIPIAENDGNHIVFVFLKPLGYLPQVVFHRSAVLNLARRMAVEQRTVDVVNLALQQADAIVKLLRYTHSLVAGETMG
jgi:hypothetical protein